MWKGGSGAKNVGTTVLRVKRYKWKLSNCRKLTLILPHHRTAPPLLTLAGEFLDSAPEWVLFLHPFSRFPGTHTHLKQEKNLDWQTLKHTQYIKHVKGPMLKKALGKPSVPVIQWMPRQTHILKSRCCQCFSHCPQTTSRGLGLKWHFKSSLR